VDKKKLLYVHVTVHRNKFLYNKTNQTHRFPKFYFVKQTLHICPSSGAFYCHIRHWYFSCRIDDSFQAGFCRMSYDPVYLCIK